VVVAATNRPNALDPALRRPGRLDREILVSVPNAAERAAILGLHTGRLALAPGTDLEAVATACHGYTGADLAALAREAALHAISEAAQRAGLLASQAHQPHPEQLEGGQGQEGLRLSAADFTAAMRKVGPSIVRGVEAEVPRIRCVTSLPRAGGPLLPTESC
jgi:SpoVK/Ycf46/Vps4 family AAA+-type ATPase